ncbi:hypothetical protein [Rubrivirga sp.]|uniref:hypothetical protein n=1 Tax=Rubrivirga sp. TaxID=1885344 RepID=UPI003C793AF6
MIRFSLVILLVLSGCDALGDSDPAWTEAGAVALFDYEPGPDSLRAFVFDGVDGEHLRLPSRPRGFEMTVVASPDWRWTDRYVSWKQAGATGGAFTSFSTEISLPLEDENIEVVEVGLAVVKSVDCSGGWFSGSSGRLSFVRVPNQSGTVEEFANCQRSYDLEGQTYPATGPETVTVPAGTFSVIRVERPVYSGGKTVEFWSWEAGLVRLDAVSPDGTLRGRFVRSAD